MIVHQHQGENECLLTTVAMLSGRLLTEVRAFVVRLERRSWQEIFNGRTEYARAAHQVIENFLGTPAARQYTENLNNAKMSVLCGSYRQGLPRLRACPPGRGMLAVAKFNRWGRARARHVMPFEGGLIYDPNRSCSVPYTWTEFRRVYRGWRVERVQQVQEG